MGDDVLEGSSEGDGVRLLSTFVVGSSVGRKVGLELTSEDDVGSSVGWFDGSIVGTIDG